MRRKAEVLQYKGQSTQGGRIESKQQQFARISQYNRVFNCVSGAANMKENVSTPTSSSNVPGPIQYLVLNPDITLYDYRGVQQSGSRNTQASINLPALEYITPSFDPTETLITTAPFPAPSLSIAHLTFINPARDALYPLNYDTQLSVSYNYTMLRPKDPDNSVTKIIIELQRLSTSSYYCVEPQNYSANYMAASPVSLPLPTKSLITLPQVTSSDGSGTETFGLVHAEKIKIPAKPEAVIRNVLNVDYSVTFYNKDDAQVEQSESNIASFTLAFLSVGSSIGFA
jgi:hypothetical protein